MWPAHHRHVHTDYHTVDLPSSCIHGTLEAGSCDWARLLLKNGRLGLLLYNCGMSRADVETYSCREVFAVELLQVLLRAATRNALKTFQAARDLGPLSCRLLMRDAALIEQFRIHRDPLTGRFESRVLHTMERSSLICLFKSRALHAMERCNKTFV